jgi:hypothetical protein
MKTRPGIKSKPATRMQVSVDGGKQHQHEQPLPERRPLVGHPQCNSLPKCLVESGEPATIQACYLSCGVARDCQLGPKLRYHLRCLLKIFNHRIQTLLRDRYLARRAVLWNMYSLSSDVFATCILRRPQQYSSVTSCVVIYRTSIEPYSSPPLTSVSVRRSASDNLRQYGFSGAS